MASKAAAANVSLPPISASRGSPSAPRTADGLATRPLTGVDPESPTGTAGLGDTLGATAAGEAPLDRDGVIDEAKQRCIDFVFKQPVIARAFVRMIVYAKYGPGVRQPDGSVRLMGPHRVLHPFEEKQLLLDEADTFITDVYGGTLSSTSLTGTRRAVDDESRGAMNRAKDKLALDALEMTKNELVQTLAATPDLIGANSKHRTFDGKGLTESVKARTRALDAAAKSAKSTPTVDLGSKGATPTALAADAGATTAGSASGKDRFPTAVEDAISTALLAERRRRIAALKRAVPSRGEVRTDLDVTERATRHFYNKTAPKAYNIRTFEDPKDVLRSLHRYASAIVDPADKNDVNVTLNVRCLRKPFVPDPNRPGWDGYCCVRNKQPSKITTLR